MKKCHEGIVWRGACGETLTIEHQVQDEYGPPRRPQLACLSHYTGEPDTNPGMTSGECHPPLEREN